MKWEYFVAKTHKTEESNELAFNTLGLEGWELVSIDEGMAFFKRPKVKAIKYEDFSEHQKRVVEYLVGGKIG